MTLVTVPPTACIIYKDARHSAHPVRHGNEPCVIIRHEQTAFVRRGSIMLIPLYDARGAGLIPPNGHGLTVLGYVNLPETESIEMVPGHLAASRRAEAVRVDMPPGSVGNAYLALYETAKMKCNSCRMVHYFFTVR